MKLVACCPLNVDGVRISIGDSFESSDYSGSKLIARGAAKSSAKAKAKKSEGKTAEK